MPTVRQGVVGEEIDEHPEVSEMIRIIQLGDPLFIARGGNEYVIISASNFSSHYTFTKTEDGYLMKKTR